MINNKDFFTVFFPYWHPKDIRGRKKKQAMFDWLDNHGFPPNKYGLHLEKDINLSEFYPWISRYVWRGFPFSEINTNMLTLRDFVI